MADAVEERHLKLTGEFDCDATPLATLRHSTSHVMAQAVKRLWPEVKVAIGPSIEDGFYYDFARPDGKQFSDEDLARIEKTMQQIIAQNLEFRREEVTKDAARALLEKMGEKFKLEHLERLEAPITLYRHGDWVDLCAGPHVPSTRFLRAVKLTHVSGAYWRGDERNPMLPRIYGTAFASKEALAAPLASIEEAKKRDHRKLVKELDLVAFHPWAPASPFFLPRGAHVYNGLVEYTRRLYVKYGYQEVITPQIFDTEVFKTSGHLPNYVANTFFIETGDDLEEKKLARAKGEPVEELPRFAIKPMNCPGHCLVFGVTRRSYRELPWRMADFGRLHRYERSGVTQGLTRVRTFCQDDGHIFCTEDQAQGEIARFIDLVYDVYRDFGFDDTRIVVATRPEARVGDDAGWDRAERALEDALKAKGLAYTVAPGEGAFYGPKIEFHLRDALKRSWQLGTIQFDFNMPARFELKYVGADNTPHQPVMLHRAILGSIERFFGVLVEHVAGAFPPWLAPEQIVLLTVSEKFNDYALEAVEVLRAAGVRASADLSNDKLGAKIRNARNMRHPYLGVVGEKEVDGRGVAVRSRDEDKDLGFMTLDAFIEKMRPEGLPPSARSK